MQFTPQQLAGGSKYSSVTKIGNWQEEIALDEARISNFKSTSSNGSSSLRKLENKMSICNEVVPHSYSEDGLIRFGDSIILQHALSSTILACDPYEEAVTGHEKFVVTTVNDDPKPKARYTFKIVKPPKALISFNDDPEDPILHVGQPFLLMCNESLLIKPGSRILSQPLYLSSTKKNERMATKRTNRQLVYMSPNPDAESVWTAIIPSEGRKNASARFLAMGLPMETGLGIQLTHRQTNMYLTCDPNNKVMTEFGVECECYADRSTAYGKLGLMISEFKGLSTSQTLAKPDAPSFSWHFIYSNDHASSADHRELPPPATTEFIIKDIQEMMKSKGVDSYWNLREYFRKFDEKNFGSNKVDREDLKSCLYDWGLDISPKNIDKIIDIVDINKVGLIDISDFIYLIRGSILPNRMGILEDTFSRLEDVTTKTSVDRKNGVPLELARNYFRGEDHPLVSLGGMDEDFAWDHLLKSLEVRSRKPKFLIFEKFVEYYGDLSATIEDDQYFESIIKSNWSSLF